jgi:hypothetical protein
VHIARFLVFLKLVGTLEGTGLTEDSVSIMRTSQVNLSLAKDNEFHERQKTVKDQKEVLECLVDHSDEIYLDN